METGMDVEEELEVLSGSLLAHTAVMTAVLGALQRKGIFDQTDINDIMDVALSGAENAVKYGANPRTIQHTRKMLEQTARNLAGPVRRWR
jgi:hypothetical protein